MSKLMKAGAFVGAVMCAATAPVYAGVSANIGVASEYIFRGDNFGDPQVSGGLDWSGKSGLYAGTWISSAGGQEEADFYAGWANDTLDFGVLHYAFPSASAQSFNVNEIYGGVNFGNFSGYLYVAPGGFNGVADDEYAYLDLSYTVETSKISSLVFHFGQFFDSGDFYDTLADPEDAVVAADGSNNGNFGDDWDVSVTFNYTDFFFMVSFSEDNVEADNVESENPQFTVGYSWTFEGK